MIKIVRSSLIFVVLISLFYPTHSIPAKRSGSYVIVTNATELQNAINTSSDGSILELQGGTYISLAVEGFNLDNLGKRLTIQAGSGQTVIISGGTHRAMHIANTSFSANKQITLKGIIFQQGVSSVTFHAGGVTVDQGLVAFIDTVFNSFSNSSTEAGPGGVLIGGNSAAYFVNSTWSNNSAQAWGGGLAVVGHSRVYIHNSQFTNNHTNLAGHAQMASGGAIFVHDSALRVTNTAFTGNEAGYVGGAIYSYGSWNNPVTNPTTDIIMANCTFTNNKALFVSGTPIGPTEGGAFHAENQVYARFYNSRFITNLSENGAGINSYRASILVENSVFLGNKANSTKSNGASGGAISLISNDTSIDGSTNRPSASLVVRGSWIQGRYGATTAAALTGGGITVNGDYNRQTGSNGVSQGGTLSDNRANVVIENTVFADNDVNQIPEISTIAALGGSIALSLAKFTMSNSMVILSDSAGTSIVGSSGGGMAVMLQSDVTLNNVVFARNTAGYAGGAVFCQGSNFNLASSIVIFNGLGVEAGSQNYGAFLFAAPDTGRGVNVTGTVENTTIYGSTGMPIYDDDRKGGPINDVHYNSNLFSTASPTTYVYINSAGWWNQNVAQLNSLTISRNQGIASTKKALVDNTQVSTAPVTGILMGMPAVLATAAPGDSTPTASYMAYAWSGGAATVDGISVETGAGYKSVNAGMHTLVVGGQSYPVSIQAASAPSILITGSQQTLFWTITGTYLDVVVSNNLSITDGLTGGVTVPVDVTDGFVLVITKEGGIYQTFPTLPIIIDYSVHLFMPNVMK